MDDNVIDLAARRHAEKPEPPPWSEGLDRDNDGEPLVNLANAMTALRDAPELDKCLGFDEMQQAAVLLAALPDRPDDRLPRALQDADVSVVQEWLQRHELRRISADVTRQAMEHRARERPFHPVRDYLSGLEWDNVPRLHYWLRTYLNVKDSEFDRKYISQIGLMFMVSMVARIMQPGCKYDYMLVLEGDQGAKKSSLCEVLAGQWFSDDMPHIGTDAVRLSMHLRGKWLVEAAELSTLDKSEVEELKAFITRRIERYIPKYGRKEVVEPRQCVLVGTTNKDTYLRDETGARRFWPVQVGAIDAAELARDRDQLFAEAVVRYRAGEPWWPDEAFEAQYIKPQQNARYELDAWEQAIETWIKTQYIRRTTILDVARDALGFQVPRLGTADQRRIGAVLTHLGWQRGARGTGGIRYWEPAVERNDA